MWLVLVLGSAPGCRGEIVEPPPDERAIDPFSPAPGQLRRLTADQFRNLVHDTLGESVVVPSSLEPDTRVEGLTALGATSTAISGRGVEQYEEASYLIAEQALAAGPERDALMPCEPSGAADVGCADLFVRRVGRRLWRRPVSTQDATRLAELAERAGRLKGDFYEGLQFALAAMLQSPSFLFRIEVGEVVSSDEGDLRRLSGWEMAERLAFFLWNTGPDDELLDAAARGDLVDDRTLRLVVDRMLDDERARHGLRTFFSEMLQLDDLDSLRKDPTVFAHFSPQTASSAREETLRVVEWLVLEEDGDYRELARTRTTFLDRQLAAIYAVPAPAREGFARFQHEPGSPRRGILGHVSVLAPHSNESSTSATRRGVFVRERLLCRTVPSPPADVNTSIPEPTAGASTLRDRVYRHLNDPFCATCHRLMDPLGLALENFDALGRYRELDNGERIDPSGDLDGVRFEDAAELADALAEHPDFPRCLTETLFRHALGHTEKRGEERPLIELHERFIASGYRVRSLIRELVLHPVFRQVGPVTEPSQSRESEESE